MPDVTLDRQIHSGFDLIDGKSIGWDESPGTDDTYTGKTIEGTAGETLLQWDICYLKADGKWYKADANATTTMPAVVMATTAMNANDVGTFLLQGFVRNDGWAGWTVGGAAAILFASGTAGEMTHTQPAGAGDQVQVVGIAFAAKIVYFNPSYEMVERA